MFLYFYIWSLWVFFPIIVQISLNFSKTTYGILESSGTESFHPQCGANFVFSFEWILVAHFI